MAKEFEELLRKQRDKMEKGDPSPLIWDKVRARVEEHHHGKGKVHRMLIISISAAACIIIVAGIFFLQDTTKKTKGQNVALARVTQKDSITHEVSKEDRSLENQPQAKTQHKETPAFDPEAGSTIAYYTTLIENRRQEIADLHGIDPELFARAMQSVEDMKQVYGVLSKQLPQSPDKKKLLRVMVENLQIQEQILNNQLQLLREVQKDKNTNNEKKKTI